MPRLYTIGPVTGIEDRNKPAFEAAQKELEAAGYFAKTPLDFIPADASHEQAMLLSINEMCTPNGLDFALYGHVSPFYQGVATLPGWEQSVGARFEVSVASYCGIPVKTVDEWIEEAR